MSADSPDPDRLDHPDTDEPDSDEPDSDRPASAGSRRAEPESDRDAEPQPAPSERAAAESDSGAESESESDQPRSGLRNPPAALRGVGAGTLVIEALVLLLAILPLRALGGDLAGPGIGAIVAMAVLCVVLAGLLRYRWAWYAGLVLQVLVIATGIAQWAIGVIGVVFVVIWWYVLQLRRTILGRI